MESHDYTQLDLSDHEAVMAEFIFPTLLAAVNQAKLDYNIASSPFWDSKTKNELFDKYEKKLKSPRGIFFDISDEVSIVMEMLNEEPRRFDHPLMKRIREQRAGITVLWLELLKKLKSWDSKFQKWVDQELASEIAAWDCIMQETMAHY